MAETTGHDTISDNGFSKIFIQFHETETKQVTCHLILLLFPQAQNQMQFVFILISKLL